MPTGLPQDTTVTNPEWVLHFCNFSDAWKLTPPKHGEEYPVKIMGEGIVIVHPDTGWTNHPELLQDGRYLKSDSQKYNYLDSANFLPGILPSALDEPTSAEDGLKSFSMLHPGHGTETASVMMSAKGHPNKDSMGNPLNPKPFKDYDVPEKIFITGVAPMVQVLPYKVARSVILWDEDDESLAKVIRQAIRLSRTKERNVGVISISLGSLQFGAGTQALREALREAREEGIVVCAAAGQLKGHDEISNHAENFFIKHFDFQPVYPGRDDNTICAAACDSNHEKYDIGFYGRSVNITAPGVQVWKACSERKLGSIEYTVDRSHGTSYPTAIVAGACAMWQAYHNRDYLIATYGKSLIFDLFKMVLTVSCDREVDFTTVNEGAERKVTRKVRLKIKPNAEGKTLIPWDDENQGAGVLDAKRLLEQELPTQQQLSDFIAQEKRAEEEKEEKERKQRARERHMARAVRFHGFR